MSALIFISPTHSSAQNHSCGTDAYTQELLKLNPELLKSIADYNSDLEKVNGSGTPLSKKGTTRTIPVVFHVIHTYGEENISKAQIEDEIKNLNAAYQRMNKDTGNTRNIFKSVAADMDVDFKLARIDPNGKCTEGITRTFSYLTDGGDDAVKALIRWDYRKYLNIWVIKYIALDATPTSKVLGYATLPSFTNSTTDGIVIRADYVGTIGLAAGQAWKSVLIHEAGHWLGLYHPFQGGCGGNCSNSGDFVCDTPPVATASSDNSGCPFTNNTCSNDFPNQLDQVENYMDYAGSCQNMFSKGQKAVVDNSFSKNNLRGLNVSAANMTATGVFNNPSCAPIADFSTANNVFTVCQGSGVTYKDYSYNGTVTNYAWTFEGGTPVSSTLSNPTIVYSSSGKYKVTLTVTNAQGNNTKIIDKLITVIPTVSATITPVSEGFESADVLSSTWKAPDTGDYGWKRITAEKYEGTACVKANIDASTLNNALYALESPPFDMTSIKGRQPILRFKVAYRPASTSANEILTVWVSINCGQSWIALKAYTNASGLGVDKVVESGWTPTTQADWKELSLDLSKYESVQNLLVKFEARSRSGNSIFLDNVNIEAVLPASLRNSTLSHLMVSIYPNPSKGSVYVDIDTKGKSFEGLRIYSISGQEYENHSILTQTKGSELNYTISYMPAGIYFAQIKIGGQLVTKKFIVIP